MIRTIIVGCFACVAAVTLLYNAERLFKRRIIIDLVLPVLLAGIVAYTIAVAVSGRFY